MKMKRQMEAGNFAKNNGKIIRAVNILAGKWIDVDTLKSALRLDMSAGELEKCMLFLLKAEYLELRRKDSRAKADWEDAARYELEVSLSGKGIRLASYYITDEAVEV